MQNFIQEYFISPIFERTGYNIVNTITYAAIALILLYVLWKLLKKRFDFSGKEFLVAAGAFVLFGSTARVVTDLSDTGAFSGSIIGSIFSYGYLTVTPGIYIVTALLFLLSLFLGRAMKNDMFAFYTGIALWLPCFLLLIPAMKHFDFFFLAVALAAAGALAVFFVFNRLAKIKLDLHEKLAILGQATDGAATFVVIDIFSLQTGKSYFEQHVLSSGIGEATPLGFFLFFLVKIALSAAIVYFLAKEKMDAKDRCFFLIVVAIMGFAPGIRGALRMLIGA